MIDCNLCIVNGRVGLNDFTHVSHRGCSVVDYVIVPREQLSLSTHFSVHSMSTVINDLNLQGCEKCSDHSVLVYELDICHTDGVISEQNPTPPKRFHLNEIPGSFLNCEESLPKIMLTIDMVKKSLAEDSDVSTAYQEFVSLMSEMSSKLKFKKPFCFKPHKSRNKPFWNDKLQSLWNEVCHFEKEWLKSKSTRDRKRYKNDYDCKRKHFDKCVQKAKRKFQLDEQKRLGEKLLNSDNPKEFWRKIGEIGMANERKPFRLRLQMMMAICSLIKLT